MGEDFRADFHDNRSSLEQQSATNVKMHMELLDNYVEIGQRLLLELRNEMESLRQEQNLMKQRILNNNDETANTTLPQIDSTFRDLKMAISTQKDENTKLQSQITELKKEKSQLQQLIITCTQKVQMLEEQIGNYTH
eukprot:TRINITY_DN1679_c0_g1_i1.p1 TRINITY_DN1679_c0_g1~~TRINITY_DN1679_c0_g1_i1.p1  ORF type:complete len:145 (+),score=35.71 TRINITY_DN1679_c0_g1_i1:27-437(+)